MLLEKQKAPFGASAILNFSGLVVRRRCLVLASRCRADPGRNSRGAERRGAYRHTSDARSSAGTPRNAARRSARGTTRRTGSSARGASSAASASGLRNLCSARRQRGLCEGSGSESDRCYCENEMNGLHDSFPLRCACPTDVYARHVKRQPQS